MIISHSRRFVFFPDPLSGSPDLLRALQPWCDQAISPEGVRDGGTPFFTQMSPAEAEWAFDALGLAFRSYIRIAVVQNPFIRMAQLYDRIACTDSLWSARKRAGFGQRDFASWLRATRPDGNGAGTLSSPRWRKFGAWSARHWCADHISYAIRQEAQDEDLTPVLAALGIAPPFDENANTPSASDKWQHHYGEKAIALIRTRYAWDLAQYGYARGDRQSAA